MALADKFLFHHYFDLLTVTALCRLLRAFVLLRAVLLHRLHIWRGQLESICFHGATHGFGALEDFIFNAYGLGFSNREYWLRKV